MEITNAPSRTTAYKPLTGKPAWLKIRLHDGSGDDQFLKIKRVVSSHRLHTICSSGRCPNQQECWSRGTATFMIGGDICTRSCRFCNTRTGKPLPIDALEPQRVAESILVMGLRYAVVTSVDRDDLADLGAGHWIETIKSVKKVNPNTTLETLIPDFQGCMELIDAVIEAQPDVISHNLETVRRLTPKIRSAARYETSLEVLSYVAQHGIPTKTGIMVGLGETAQEVEQLMDDARHVGVQIITIGQYLQPSRKHIPVTEYVSPQQFEAYRQMALSKGFSQVMSAPLVRSSYHADQASI